MLEMMFGDTGQVGLRLSAYRASRVETVSGYRASRVETEWIQGK